MDPQDLLHSVPSPKLNSARPSTDNLKFLKSLMELTASVDEGIIITDEKEKILWVNKMFEKICGMTLGELKGKNPNVLQGKGTNKSTVRQIRSSLDESSSVNTDILNYKPDDTPYWIRLCVAPVENIAGETVNFVGFEHDVTHEKKIEGELVEAEKIYKDLFELSPCVMWICDIVEFGFIEVNRAAIEKYGYSREEFLSMTLKDIKPPEDMEKLHSTFRAEDETYRDRGVWKHIKKNGEVIFVDVKTNRINYGGKICSIAFLNDVTDKVKREAEIKALNLQLEERVKFIESVSDNVPGALFQTLYFPDGTEKMIYASEGFAEFWGVPVKDALEDSNIRFKFIHPDDMEETVKAFRSAAKNLTKLNAKYRYVNNTTDEIIWARVTGMAHKLNDGTVAFTGAVINVNESEKYYIELEKSNQRYKYVSKAVNELIWDLDLITGIISFGGSYKEMFGYVYQDDKIELKKIRHFVHPDDLARVEKGIASALADKTKRYWEDYYRVLKKGGGTVYVHDRAYIIYDDKSNSPVRFVGAVQNITQRKKDEDAILEQMRKVNIIIDSITDVFYVIDSSYNLLFVNETMEKLSGYKNVELIGRNVWKVFEDADLSLPKELFKKAFKENIPVEFEMEYQKRNFHVHLQPSEIGLVVSGKDVTETRKYEEQIKRDGKFIKEISDSIDGFVFQAEYDKEAFAKVNYVSKKASDFINISVDEAIRDESKILDFMYPDDIEFAKKSSRDMIANLTNTDFKFRYIDKVTNEIKWLKVAAIPTRLDNGNTVVNGIVIDITEMKMREEEIESNAKFMAEISDSIDGFIYQTEYDTQGVLRVNYSSEKSIGYSGVSVQELKVNRSKILESVHPEDIVHLTEKRKEMVANLTKLNTKFRYVNKQTNEVKWMKATAVPTRLDNGHTIVNGIMLDITEIENNFAQLVEANTRYEYLSKATHETIWEVDIGLHEMQLGGEYKEMFGCEFPGDKISFDKWKKFVHPDDLEKTLECMQNVLNDPLGRYSECSYRIIRKNGEIIDVFEKAFIITDEKTGEPVKIIGSTQDITQLRKVETERNHIVIDLVKRNKALEQFTFMVSHNLRAPIANMLGIQDILESENLEKETKEEMYRLNKTSVYRLNEVIKDMNEILDIKKSIEENKTDVVFSDILNKIEGILDSSIKETQIEIISDFRKASSMYSIKSYIYSIFQNLISNSIKYRQDGSSLIKITSDEDADYTYLTFEDDGLGIDLVKNGSKIFGLYNRFNFSKEGKGMGLFMVKSQIEDLNGEINIESKLNIGTKFFIKIRKQYSTGNKNENI